MGRQSATRVHENLRDADILIVTFRRVVSYDSGYGDLNLAVGEPRLPASDTTFRVLTIFRKVEPCNQVKNKSSEPCNMNTHHDVPSKNRHNQSNHSIDDEEPFPAEEPADAA